MKKLVPMILLLLLVAGAIIFRVQLLTFGRAAWSAGGDLVAGIRNPTSETDTNLVASGSVEARTLDIASPTGGRITGLHVIEGQAVAAGDLIAEMDTGLLDAQITEARAAVAIAQAQVALLKAGARETDLAVARAAAGQALAARDAAQTAQADAAALVDAPNDLDVKIAQAAAAVQVAGEQAAAAQAVATAADLEMQLWGRIVKSAEEGFDVPLPIPGGGVTHVAAPAERLGAARLQWNLASQHTWEAHAKHVSALAAQDAARQTLADLQRQRAEPLALRSQADAAAAARAVAEAAVGVAQANVAVLEAGAPAEQIAAAEAVVQQAEAAVHTLETKKAQARIVAPEAGTITALVLHSGEVAGPGTTIIRLTDLTQATLTVYVPEPRLGEVALGQGVQVAVDSFPGRAFPGTVTSIASRAEFTPKNVQTRDERANTVFAVKITLDNQEAALKPGMPADATFCIAQTADCGQAQESVPPDSSFDHPPSTIYSGAIEATEVRSAAEVGGRVAAIHAEEGAEVQAGQVLVALDGEELAARRAQAAAAVAAARAEWARVAADPQPARIAQAEAGVKQAEAALAATLAAVTNARKLRENPQELDAQISNARSQVRTATTAIDTAQAGLKTAQVLQESLPAPGSDEDRTRRAIYDQNAAAAATLVRAAQAQTRGAQSVLAQLLAIREKPVALDAAVHRAEGEVGKAQAALATAQAVLAQTSAAAQPEAVAVAQARLAQAEAALATLDATSAKLAVRSPITGIVTAQAIHTGEVAQAGATLFTVIDLRQVKLVIYVPTSQIGQVRLGEAAQVTVDTYPGRAFTGYVARIADHAEFTPKNVQTQEERVKTVFAVEIALDNLDGALKVGMPADAILQ